MPRLSILGTMGLVLAIAVAAAALREANDAWAGLLTLLTALLLGYSVLAVIYYRGRDRAWWLGFSLFAFGFFLIDYGLGAPATGDLARYVSDKIGPPPSANSMLAHYRNQRNQLSRGVAKLNANGASREMLASLTGRIARLDAQILAITNPPRSPEAKFWLSTLPGAANYRAFLRVIQCIFAVLAGLVGATLARRVQARSIPPSIEPVD